MSAVHAPAHTSRTNARPSLRRVAATALLALASWLPVTGAQANDYPSKPVTVIVPYAPGGITDGLGRQVAQFLGQHFKQTGLVENKPGAGASIGGRLLASAKPDGHTLGVFDPTGITVTPQLYSKPPYDSVKAFVPITRLGNNYQVFIAHPDAPVNTLADLVALAKKTPGLPMANPATINHIELARWADMAKVEISHVSYKGSSPMMQDVMAGQVPLAFVDVASAYQYLVSGKLKAIAVTSKERLDLLPKVPTVAESGYAGYEAVAWFGVFAPAGTPKDVVTQLDKALQQFGHSKEYGAWAKARSFFPSVSANPEDFAKTMRAEADSYHRIGQQLNIRLD